MRITFLGTGTSTGVPVLTCECAVCTSDDPRDIRLRPSVMLEWDGASVIIDSSPDFRQQALRYGISRVDAVLYTHSHADHLLGLDDLRIFGFRLENQLMAEAERIAAASGSDFDKDEFRRSGAGNIPLFCEENVEENIRHIFHYAFDN